MSVSDCGYNHTAAGTKTRQSPLPFTECPAHLELTYSAANQRILRVRGLSVHNSACEAALYSHEPRQPLHPSVFAIALKQLAEGVNLDKIQETNSRMYKDGSYTGQPTNLDNSKSAYRWLLKRHDTRSLYRQYNRLHGVNVTEAAHVNIDEWMDKDSPRYDPTIASAIFHYSARAEKGDRFEICIATKEMKDAAWRHGDRSQILMDGTFGVSTKKMLLFILMGLDEKRRGEPMAMFLFSAPSGNRHTAAGYNTDILERLLSKWKTSLGEKDGRTFEPAVAITDTDLMERNALMRVFPDIWLLICKFHIRQSWRNHRNKLLRGRSPVHMSLKTRMARLEAELVVTKEFGEAQELLAKEKIVLEAMLEDYPAIASNALAHLHYLGEGYWMKAEALWRSWSDYGRRYAAILLRCDIEGVLTTTNHLESFNGILKRKHLRRWQRGNRRLRVDILVKLLVTKILPAIFEQRSLELQEDDRWRRLLLTLPGGATLVGELSSTTGQAKLPPVAYLVPNESRDQAAAQLLQENQMSVPSIDPRTRNFLFSCYSSLATVYDPNPTLYNIAIATEGNAGCDCLDFTQRGGACKHIRAALIWIETRRQEDPRMPLISLPSSEQEARSRKLTSLSILLQSTVNGPDMNKSRLPTGVPRGIPPAVIEDAIREANETLYEDGDDGAEEGESIDEEDDSDLESVATDAGEDDEFTFTTLDHTGSARRAIEDQTFARVLFDLASVAPKLGQLGRYLMNMEGSFRTDEDVEKAAKAKAEIDLLSQQLGRLLANKAAQSSTSLSAQDGSGSRTPPQAKQPTFATLSSTEATQSSSKGEKQSEAERMRLKRAALFPHSPEKDAKRASVLWARLTSLDLLM